MAGQGSRQQSFSFSLVICFCLLFPFQKLLKGQDNWSLSELIQAIVILIHTHSLCSFVYGCGITPEIDRDGGHTFKPPSLSDLKSGSTEGDQIAVNGVQNRSCMADLLEKMKEVKAEHDALKETTQEELYEQFERVESCEGKKLELPDTKRSDLGCSKSD